MDNNKLFQDLIGYHPDERKPMSEAKLEKEVEKAKSFDFMKAVKDTLNEEPYNASVTENGAVGYKTTGNKLVDLNFKVSSLRNRDEKYIVDEFMKAYFENPMEAMLWLFYLRDVRGGLGERRSFRIILKHLGRRRPKEIIPLIPYIAEYGRYDDIWELLHVPHKEIREIVTELVKSQLIDDLTKMKENKSISLLGKWLPSANASSRISRYYAKLIYTNLNILSSTYKKMCSKLRKYLRVVECDMSENRWSVIDYNSIPSKANLIYKNAFLAHDKERREAYLEALTQGKAKINASTLFPHEIVNKYIDGWGREPYTYDETYEQLWKNLPDTVKGAGNVMVVADGSGSMTQRVGNSQTLTALQVANALAIYFSERCFGVYRDKYITFSMHPRYVDLSKCKTLKDKLTLAAKYNECANTNIQAVFELILDTARENKLPQEELPGTILILSDMEFDGAVNISKQSQERDFWGQRRYTKPDKNFFKQIQQKYEEAGYKLPKLVFWNICSRTDTIPVKENDLGVGLVSGFSVNIVKMILSNKLDPFAMLLEQLYDKRYEPIYNALVPLLGESELKKEFERVEE